MIWGARSATMDKMGLRKALRGTLLEGRRVIELPIPGTREVALATPITADELEAAWTAARALVDVTGRWPVAVVSWIPEGDWERSMRTADLFSRVFFDDAQPPQSAAQILDASEVLTAEDVASFVATSRAECLEFEAENHFELSPSHEVHDPWHPFTEPAALLFLPWEKGWDSLAYINFYDSAYRGIAETIALARRWEVQFGAELVAHFGTILEVLVARPPATVEEATELAREQFAIAPDTFYIPAEPPLSIAPALVGQRRWLLHQRP